VHQPDLHEAILVDFQFSGLSTNITLSTFNPSFYNSTIFCPFSRITPHHKSFPTSLQPYPSEFSCTDQIFVIFSICDKGRLRSTFEYDLRQRLLKIVISTINLSCRSSSESTSIRRISIGNSKTGHEEGGGVQLIPSARLALPPSTVNKLGR